ncbi:hypothetical protein C823_007765 [Eubacterium plexicaudatum ASF492]|uniref:Uncharacterized protein n=1 Tax=Eubacterium plexicaudatum ASF492 TaxID=1235802 RepID=N1ZVQ8_9FIRM|nr:hypothetical protein C823_007765 [Eubacterium plexicaudatum ASF492]
MKLKDKIRKWLFSDEMNRITSLEEKYNEFDNWIKISGRMYSLSAEAKKNCECSQRELEECRKLITQICDVGVDVGFRGEEHSWAVVCVAGNPEYVKFISLNRGDAQQVMDFLKRFQYSKHVIDSPLAFRNILRKEMFL